MNKRIAVRKEMFRVLDDLPGFKLVQVGRRHKLSGKRHLPAGLIYTGRDEQEVIGASPLTYRHELEAKVVLYQKSLGFDAGESALDDLMDLADAHIIPALNALDFVEYAVPVEWDDEGDGKADADYLMGERMYKVVYDSAD